MRNEGSGQLGGQGSIPFGPVVARVEAGVVDLTVDAYPVGLVDPSGIAIGRTSGQGAGELDPAALPYGDGATTSDY